MNEPNRTRVSNAAELDALIGVHVTGETPELLWEDSHGHFQFATEKEALQAISDPYYQKFLPEVDWAKTVVRQIRIYRLYCSDPAAIWAVVEKATTAHGPLLTWREHGRWHAAFGGYADADARTPSVAICLAALQACKLLLDVNHDRIDAQIQQVANMASLSVPE